MTFSRRHSLFCFRRNGSIAALESDPRSRGGDLLPTTTRTRVTSLETLALLRFHRREPTPVSDRGARHRLPPPRFDRGHTEVVANRAGAVAPHPTVGRPRRAAPSGSRGAHASTKSAPHSGKHLAHSTPTWGHSEPSRGAPDDPRSGRRIRRTGRPGPRAPSRDSAVGSVAARTRASPGRTAARRPTGPTPDARGPGDGRAGRPRPSATSTPALPGTVTGGWPSRDALPPSSRSAPPASRVRTDAGRRAPPSRTGPGCAPPLRPHEHGPSDLSDRNGCGTFSSLRAVRDGRSRDLVPGERRAAGRPGPEPRRPRSPRGTTGRQDTQPEDGSRGPKHGGLPDLAQKIGPSALSTPVDQQEDFGDLAVGFLAIFSAPVSRRRLARIIHRIDCLGSIV